MAVCIWCGVKEIISCSFLAVNITVAINIGGSLFYNAGAGDGTRPVHGCMEIYE